MDRERTHRPLQPQKYTFYQAESQAMAMERLCAARHERPPAKEVEITQLRSWSHSSRLPASAARSTRSGHMPGKVRS